VYMHVYPGYRKSAVIRIALRAIRKADISPRSESDLEMKRSKVTKEKTDIWYSKFKDFLISKDLVNSPSRIWNADEAGFNMGANKAKVIGPTRRDLAVPHITSGKQRPTVMFCGNVSGQMMPPYCVYP